MLQPRLGDLQLSKLALVAGEVEMEDRHLRLALNRHAQDKAGRGDGFGAAHTAKAQLTVQWGSSGSSPDNCFATTCSSAHFSSAR